MLVITGERSRRWAAYYQKPNAGTERVIGFSINMLLYQATDLIRSLVNAGVWMTIQSNKGLTQSSTSDLNPLLSVKNENLRFVTDYDLQLASDCVIH